MNTYVMGEIATLLAVTVLAGMLVGWCIKSLMTGRTERKVRAHVAHDVDDSAADVASIRQTLLRREAQLKDTNQELQKMRGRDVSMKAGNTTQIEEINKLKNELALARQSLDRNRSEFNSFRNDKQTELQQVGNKLASFQSGGAVHDERMLEANDTIGALRTAVRENDKVIDSLRARIKEGDSSVENLRTQLKSSETQLSDALGVRQTTETTIAKLNMQLQDVSDQRDKFKRDYDAALETKNKDIAKQQVKLEGLSKIQTTLANKEHENKKLTQVSQANATRANEQINELKRTISEKEAQRAESLKNLKRMQDQISTIEAKNTSLTAEIEKQKTLHSTIEAKNNALTAEADKQKTLLSTIEAKNNSLTAEAANQKALHAAQLQKTTQELESARSISKKVENKSAEVVALNDMLKDISTKKTEAQSRVIDLEKQLKSNTEIAANNAESQRKIASITATLQDRDSTVAKLRTDMDDLVASRNDLSIQLGELETNSDKTKATLIQRSEQQIMQMKTALQDRDKSFDKLRGDMDKMAGTRDRLTQELENLQQQGSQLETFKANLQSTVTQRESELQQRKAAYDKLQKEFQQLASTRDDYEQRISALTSEVKAQAQQLQVQEKRTTQKITQLQPQISTLRSKLSLADSENQRLSSELANSASLKLAITERDSTIQKLQVDLQDTKMNGIPDPTHDDAIKKADSLTVALKDRDTEIARLNNIVTDNRLGSKKHQSEATLLKQEVESQSTLIKNLEEQAENTLTLHKKIASQSTEIEKLRASLYENEGTASSSKQSANQPDNQTVLALKAQVQQQANETASIRNQLAAAQQSLAQSKLQQVAPVTDQSKQAKNSKTPTANSQNEAQTTSAKPRVFVRQDNNSTEALTGVSSLETTGRANYTRDGYKLQRTNGQDNLALLPGIDAKAERELNNNGVTDFEQIALWGKREISHFSDRAGLTTTEAESYDWPKLAREILAGSYRRSDYKEKDNS